MKWVRLPVTVLAEKERAALADADWRLLVEYDLLCGKHNGPLNNDPEEVAWLLHRDPAEVARGTTALLEQGFLLLTEDGRIAPSGWMERNASYLAKMDYNRERYRDLIAPDADTPSSEGETPMNPTVEELWNALPGNGGRPTDGTDALAAMRAGIDARREWQRWAVQQSLVARAPEEVQQVSWLLSTHAGMLPFGSRKSWAQAVSELWKAADHSYAIVENAVKKAAQDRAARGITLSSPRSFMGYARNEAAVRRMGASQDQQLDLGLTHPTEAVDL